MIENVRDDGRYFDKLSDGARNRSTANSQTHHHSHKDRYTKRAEAFLFLVQFFKLLCVLCVKKLFYVLCVKNVSYSHSPPSAARTAFRHAAPGRSGARSTAAPNSAAGTIYPRRNARHQRHPAPFFAAARETSRRAARRSRVCARWQPPVAARAARRRAATVLSRGQAAPRVRRRQRTNASKSTSKNGERTSKPCAIDMRSTLCSTSPGR